MKRFIWSCLLFAACWPGVAQTNANRQLLVEQQNYVAWTARVLSPDCWFSYHGKLYAQANNQIAREALADWKEAISKYTALTNASDRRKLTESILMQQQGAEKLLAPEGSTNLFSRLLPRKTIMLLPSFNLIQSLINGDGIVQDTQEDPNTYYIYDLGRAVDGKYYYFAVLLYEGLKTYETAGGATKTVKAYTSVRLSEEEEALLLRVKNAFKAKSLELTQTINGLSKAAK